MNHVTVHCQDWIDKRRGERELRDLPAHIEHAEEVVAFLEAIPEGQRTDSHPRALENARARVERLEARLERLPDLLDGLTPVETRGLNNDEKTQVSRDRQHVERPVR